LQPAFVQLLRSQDRQEYLRALQENRAPVYVGRYLACGFRSNLFASIRQWLGADV